MEKHIHGSTVEQATQTERTSKHDIIGGVALVAMGILLLLGQFFNIGWVILPVLAGGFILGGMLTREAGWFIPGGILAGISLGVFAIDGPYAMTSNDTEGGLFLLCFALGWAGIYVLSKLFSNEPQQWALIPAGVMAIVGAAVLSQDIRLLQLLQLLNLWPIIFVLMGISIIVRNMRGKDES